MAHPKSEAAKSFLKKKFHKLKDEGYEGKQRVAVALNMAREKGYKVGKKPEHK
jgi:hypothetical protein